MRFVLPRFSLFLALSAAQPSASNAAYKTAHGISASSTHGSTESASNNTATHLSPTEAASFNLSPASSPTPHPPHNLRNGLFLQSPSLPADLPPEKHFHEATFDNHYDGRFALGPISYHDRSADLHKLIVSYLDTMRDLGVETWLMHGTLLGWWWNKKILAWDEDADVQMTTESLQFLGSYYNMSIWNFNADGRQDEGGGGAFAASRGADEHGLGEGNGTEAYGKNGKTYLLEINPHHHLHDGSALSDANVIDARWIDTATGLYVDITCLWKAVDHPAGSGILTGKDGHSFREKYIFPLRETSFEGREALVPSAYLEMLGREYGGSALVDGVFEGHYFDDATKEWVLLPNSTTTNLTSATTIINGSSVRNQEGPAHSSTAGF